MVKGIKDKLIHLLRFVAEDISFQECLAKRWGKAREDLEIIQIAKELLSSMEKE